jgi:hypothetical protein
MPGPVWTADEAKAKAREMGWTKTNYRAGGGEEAVFKKGRHYISRDEDGHNGGAWKMADSPEKLQNKKLRMGTFNKDLTQRVGA